MFPGFWDCFKSDEEEVTTVIGLYCESSMIAHSGLHKNALVTSQSALQGVSKWNSLCWNVLNTCLQNGDRLSNLRRVAR